MWEREGERKRLHLGFVDREFEDHHVKCFSRLPNVMDGGGRGLRIKPID